MKQDDTTLFQALQDPLFTLIALVLINTLWIIIPGGRGPAGEPPPKDIRGQLTDLVVETRQLEGQVQGIEQAIHTEEMNVASLTDQGSLQEEEEKKLIDNLEGRISVDAGDLGQVNARHPQQGFGQGGRWGAPRAIRIGINGIKVPELFQNLAFTLSDLGLVEFIQLYRLLEAEQVLRTIVSTKRTGNGFFAVLAAPVPEGS